MNMRLFYTNLLLEICDISIQHLVENVIFKITFDYNSSRLWKFLSNSTSFWNNQNISSMTVQVIRLGLTPVHMHRKACIEH